MSFEEVNEMFGRMGRDMNNLLILVHTSGKSG